MLSVLGPAHAAGQFHFACYIVISLAETGIGIQHIGILAEEIIVTFIVQFGERIGVYVKAGPNASCAAIWTKDSHFEPPSKHSLLSVTPRNHKCVAIHIVQRQQRECVDEDIIVFLGFIVQIIAARR